MFKLKTTRFLLLIIAGLFAAISWNIVPCVVAQTASPSQISAANSSGYQWQNVAIGGGGFVTGMAIHPNVKDLIYVRTDVGGAYRWDAAQQRWLPLMEMFGQSESYLYGIESLALDRNNPNIIYAAAGEYTDSRSRHNGVILKSSDRGQSWTQTPLSFKLGANEDWRWNGERLAVDPNQSNLLYLGSRHQGLWKSEDGAKTWTRVTNFPTPGTPNRGIVFILFDPKTGTPGTPTSTVYVGVAGAGVYRSQDRGQTWTLLQDSAKNPQRGVLASDSTLYVTFDAPGAIKKFRNNAWVDITPATLDSYNAISVSPSNPQLIVAAQWFFNHGNKLFKSTNGGQTWQEIQANHQSSIPWKSNDERFWTSGISSLSFDPHYRDRVWYTDGWGIWRTDEINRDRSVWRNVVSGLEEIVNFTLASSPRSGTLFQGSADIGGLRHETLNGYPPKLIQSPSWMTSDFVSMDLSSNEPDLIVSVGSRRWTSSGFPDPGYGVYSTNDGRSWTEFPAYPNGYRKAQRGRVAVAAQGDRTWVWIPEGENEVPYTTQDRGKTWTRSTGAPAGLTTTVWQWNQPLASDKVDPNQFYLYKNGSFYRSTNSGKTWQATVNNLPRLDMDWANNAWSTIKAAPGLKGEVWASFNREGLYRSRNGGTSFTKLPNVQQAYLFAFGKNPPNRQNPTVFVYGTVNNAAGIFRSDNLGETWVKIDVPGQAIGKDPKFMEGDARVYGRVYIGMGGRGIYYGQPANLATTSQGAASSNHCRLPQLLASRL
ncbi:hypothetical protein QPK87_17060 [Kamptonema cortianum]|uniref:Xyloglucanase n=1 Tax=Geitlerinema calcuttense NRMC-F 0142 TaxID=2922238 RepID=A0ABT7LWX9_9CYAN|nr:hypothetical protein [Geitlerinema calcuttense]MDK3158264.1 hypothetical protein [Kamptonema cortianum]MDL5056524.1 hypothetical protein [Geitlerinema calcuttense NRMC-F 0142]